MISRAFAAGILALMTTGYAAPAPAEDCGPLKIVASVDLKMAGGDSAAFVPVTLEGQTRYMLLDTGGTVSEVTASTVASLGLESHKTPTLRFYDVKGNYVDHATIVPDFAIGDLKGSNVDFVVGPDDLFPKNDNIAGILGPGILRFYDVGVDSPIERSRCSHRIIAKVRSFTGRQTPLPQFPCRSSGQAGTSWCRSSWTAGS